MFQQPKGLKSWLLIFLVEAFLPCLTLRPRKSVHARPLKELQDMKRAGYPHRFLEGKNIVLLFEKTSTRTRCAFEVGGMDLGMGVTYLDPGSSQMGKKESIEGYRPRARSHV